MQTTYCDLCMTPIKEGESCILYISSPIKFTSLYEYEDYIKKVQKEAKEICPTCKHIFDKIFELRMTRLSELTEEINLTFRIPAKKNNKERRNGKEKE